MIATVPSSEWELVMKASGQDGVFARPFFEDRAKYGYRHVPLAPATNLAEAARQHAFLASGGMGIVQSARGLCIRVKSADFDQTIRVLRPEDFTRYVGNVYHVSGIPLGAGPGALQ